MISIKTLTLYLFSILLLAACKFNDNDPDTKDIAIEKIAAYAQGSSNSAPTIQDYLDAGVTGVNNTNLAELNATVDGLNADDVDTPTLTLTLTLSAPGTPSDVRREAALHEHAFLYPSGQTAAKESTHRQTLSHDRQSSAVVRLPVGPSIHLAWEPIRAPSSCRP